jgi:outer membrane receptor protein involved in Fe transport
MARLGRDFMASAACIRARLAITVSATALFIAAVPALAQTAAPQAGPAPTVVDDIIVTAQKREESIQDVPIAVSAFSAENLEALQIEGGSELVRAIPNVSFSKANFSMYNFSIRGIGTKAVSASSDPAVAVSFNNSPLIRNRLFEQEYLDVNRVEVLRGPQGTLYGRNATGGVVNMIPNLPGPDFEGMIRGEVGNHGSLRGQGMINIPVTDTFWVRAAGAYTQRDGFDYNSFTEQRVNDRQLWSTRLSAAWEPNDRFRANLIWEHFDEDDRRARTGKQLCTRDPGPAQVGDATPSSALRNRLSQGCLPGSLYDDAAYGAPNAASLAYMVVASGIPGGYRETPTGLQAITVIDPNVDPYAGVTQSRDLREFSMAYDPVFRATNDVVQLNLEANLTDSLTFYSQTVYAKDDYYSSQDYARYLSNPVINDLEGVVDFLGNPLEQTVTVNGEYLDPQLGASNRMVSADLSRSDNRQFYQEFRLNSDFGGGFDFNIGANYLNFKSQDDYFVFNNIFSLLAEYWYNIDVSSLNIRPLVCDDTVLKECVYVDPSSMEDLAGDGHNYFRSLNEVEVESWAVFGEGYWDLSPTVRLTTGLRYTDDTKISTPYPSQLLLGADFTGEGIGTGGYIRRGFTALPDVKQNWTAVTGRAVLDWKPELGFTDDTLIYASYARGYKGGGTNPPRMDLNPDVVQYQPLASEFDPEYVDAFEIGTKNSLLDGRLRLNTTAFYYDYKDYQVSQIVDRISLNENFDARSWGLELETIFQPTENLRIDANVGYLNTRIADGAQSIDVMNRTQGNEDWVLVRPWLQVPSNCIAPKEHVETILNSPFGDAFGLSALSALCGGSVRTGSFNPDFSPENFPIPLYLLYGFEYDYLTEAPNGGRGFFDDLGGNELPNSPNWTSNIGIQYTWFPADYEVTLRADYYWQSSSYARVYNSIYDEIRSWDNTNVSLEIYVPAWNASVRAYVKNVFDESPIVDAFTNSDDSGLTTNVFTLDPRIIAIGFTKSF